MHGHTDTDDAAPRAETSQSLLSVVPRTATWTVWSLFLLSVAVLVFTVAGGREWPTAGPFRIDGLTVVMWVVATFFSGIVHSYSRRYLAGEKHKERFFVRVFAFTLLVALLVAADHIVLFVAAWLAMGLVMASLIGCVRGWDQARAAARIARRYFLASSGLLAISVTILAVTTETASISGILASAGSIPRTVGLVALGGLVLAAMIQSALVPVHGWLLSSMTAPTPASALMHAGFVNAGGVLLTRFAPVLTAEVAVMSLVVLVGAASALLGQAMLQVQPNVKRKLGSSTLAQMGFMILQCGLGFFAAAITHLILHGFYKAYLFLASGAVVEQTTPKRNDRARLGPWGIAASLAAAAGGGVVFAVLTGKGLALDSGLVLTLVVSLTALHAARDVLRRPTLGPSVRLFGLPLVVLAAVSIYATLYNAVAVVMADVPMAQSGTELTVVHLIVLAAFGVSYAVTEFGWHRDSNRLYVALMNLSQPAPTTVLTRTEEYNDA